MRATDISRGRQILVRFLALAEERLAYLTGLYETGRWTRYFTQTELLDNVRDAKNAVDAWKLLVSTEALPNNRPVDLDWLNHGRPLPARQHLLPDVEHRQLSARFMETMPEPDFDSATFQSVARQTAAIHPRPGVAEPIRTEKPMMVVPVTTDAVRLPAPAVAAVLKPVIESPKPAAWQNSLDFALMRERYPLLRKTG
jgi:uncharacterized repeat protein (TIGR03809 family)